MADLGTGSGAIAAAIAQERPQWVVHATDVSTAALAIAIDNFRHLKLTVHTHHGSWYAALPPNLRLDIILSNPPYIADTAPHLTQGDLVTEPRQALAAGLMDSMPYAFYALRL